MLTPLRDTRAGYSILVRFLPLILALLLVGCEHEGPVEPDPGDDSDTPSFSTIQTTIFNTSCALSGCHAGSNPQQGMDLSEGAAYEAIVGVRSNERPDLFRIEPGDPDQSYLVMKIEGSQGIVGGRMPLGRPPLSNNQITLVRDWVLDGAPEN